MKSRNRSLRLLTNKSIIILLLLGLITSSCHKEEDLIPATFSSDPTVYIDGFSAGLDYFPFGDSRLDAFSVDEKTFYEGTSAMRFDIPNVGDPKGAYAGAIFPVPDGRDLTGYDALTFWAQASQPGTINEVGFGNDFGENKHLVTLPNLQLTTNWTKYTIPLPDASKLTQEKGLFWYAEGPEDGKGYTFWIDELQYEKLGTVAQPRPSILNGQEQSQQTFIGVSLTLGGLTQTFNLEDGEDVTVNVAPAYFEFISSDPTVATVNDKGIVTIIGAGNTVITASLGEKAAAGSLTIESLGEFTPAPTPTRDANSVISIFSDAYTNVPVNFYNGYFEPFQTTQGQDDIDLGGDKIIKYSQLNFVATEFTEPTVNANAMTHFHVDIQVEDLEILPEDFIRIQLGDFGANGVFDGGGDDSNGSFTLASQDLQSGQWLSLDIPLSGFSGLSNKSNLAQILFITDGTATDLPGTITDILVDNMYFYSGEVIPSANLPIDFENGENLTGAFDGGANGSNADNPDQSGINTSSKVYQFNKVAGSEWYSGMFNIFDENLDLSEGTTFKFKIWSPKENINVRFQLEKEGGEGNPPTYLIDQTLNQANTWVELSFDFSNTSLNPSEGYDKIVIFPDFDEANQVPVANDAIYYIDDISQDSGGGTGTGPSTPAPNPTYSPENVISVYSDTYSSIGGTDFFPDWGQATTVSEETIEGDNILTYSGLNYQGIVLGASQNLSGMEFLHIDYWTANSTALNTFLISTGPVENGKALTVPTSGVWNSVDLPLGDFSLVDLLDVIQMKFDGDGDIYLDNIYFYTTGGTMETSPSVPAPEPTENEVNVISIYSDAYSSITGNDLNPDWGQTTMVTEEMIGGDNTLVYTGLDYQGLVLGSSQDVSGMDFLHLDYWTANSTALNHFLISTGPVEVGKALSVPTGGSWNSVDIPLGDFAGVDLADIIQMKFDGNGDVYLDNIYFFKNGGGSGGDLFPIDFEDGSTLTGAFDGGANGAIADNPDQNGINTSSKVYQFNKIVGSAWYSGVFNVFSEDIDASNSTTFKIKLWSPKENINVRFQLEKEGNQGPIVTYNLDQTLTEANQWVELTFDFSSTALSLADGYDKIVIFPDYNESNQDPVATEAIYYIDDISQK